MQLVTAERKDMGFCPGCSHGLVLEHLGRALEQLGCRPHRVCLVSDIGCIGIADRYFACHTFHGLHGRSVTYAEGIKRVRPDTTVVVLMGDGGSGIGTAHLVHAARRGVDITVLVCNNFNFGMTGGQQSPTTPTCARTTTTPAGSTDHPFDVCSTVAVNGARFVARQSAHDAGCVELIMQAIAAPGFALVDLWELCVAYQVPLNKLTTRRLVELSQELCLPFGRVRHPSGNGPRPPARAEARPPSTPATHGGHAAIKSDTPRRAGPRPADPSQETTARSAALPWPRRTEICIAGSAGQHVRAACGVLGEIAVACGLYAAQQDDFPITVRRGHSVSRLIVATDPIFYTGADAPDLVVIISRDGLDRVQAGFAADPNALVLVEESLDRPATSARMARFRLRDVERAAGKASAALALLISGVVQCRWTDASSLLSAAQVSLTGRFRDDWLAAMRIGAALQPHDCCRETRDTTAVKGNET